MARKSIQKTITSMSVKLAVESNPEFRDGVCSGYLTYYDLYQNKPLTDADVYTFLVQNFWMKVDESIDRR